MKTAPVRPAPLSSLSLRQWIGACIVAAGAILLMGTVASGGVLADGMEWIVDVGSRASQPAVGQQSEPIVPLIEA